MKLSFDMEFFGGALIGFMVGSIMTFIIMIMIG